MLDNDDSTPTIIHAESHCDSFHGNWFWKGTKWSLSFEDNTIYLEAEVSEPWGIEEYGMGDFSQAEVPNCPFCGSYILVGQFFDTLSPWEFFTGEKADYEN